MREGYQADLVLFEEDRIRPLLPTVEKDLPGGARRLVQKAEGIKATLVNGAVAFENGEATGARFGHVLKGGSRHESSWSFSSWSRRPSPAADAQTKPLPPAWRAQRGVKTQVSRRCTTRTSDDLRRGVRRPMDRQGDPGQRRRRR